MKTEEPKKAAPAKTTTKATTKAPAKATKAPKATVVDPFAETQWHFGPIPVSAKGAYSVKGKATTPITDAGTMTVAISGSFKDAQTVTGKITFSQNQEGATCGPRTVTFTATSNTKR